MNVGEKLDMCLKTLMEIRESGYWPYASPCPCSTEVRIKESIDKAVNNLECALYWHNEEFGKHNRKEIGATNSEIVEL